MLKACVKAVLSGCTSLGISSNLDTLYTTLAGFLLTIHYSAGNLYAYYGRLGGAFEQAFLMVYSPLNINFYPLSTGPNTTNKLIKELYI